MKAKRAMGWGVPEDIRIDRDNVDVHLCGVCTCSWHKQCVAEKQCRKLFADGGMSGANRTLKYLMGGKLPKGWGGDRYVRGVWEAKHEAMDIFRRDFFERCRPLRVEVRDR